MPPEVVHYNVVIASDVIVPETVPDGMKTLAKFPQKSPADRRVQRERAKQVRDKLVSAQEARRSRRQISMFLAPEKRLSVRSTQIINKIGS